MRKTLAIALAATALLVACGSDDDDTATTEAPATSEAPSTEAPMGTEAPAAEDIVAIASANEDFSTLVAAVSAAGLVETLQGEGPFTVFAPTNAAFDALPAGLLDKLLMPENKDVLVKILTYHVVSGAIMAADVTAGDVASVEGGMIAVTTNDGGVQVNGASVVSADIVASNGVIHVIDAVILPPDVDPAAL
ncbi:MAG: fasciclin domain-containing protein [Acidimicrobiia bacterium]|nr:fasciclin domain-containing protein [Actinomycetota bacterium]NDH48593.1 fasciclin domain-containing protein [Acidimicrobiia bacterium]